jgi:hypothetical protein
LASGRGALPPLSSLEQSTVGTMWADPCRRVGGVGLRTSIGNPRSTGPGSNGNRRRIIPSDVRPKRGRGRSKSGNGGSKRVDQLNHDTPGLGVIRQGGLTSVHGLARPTSRGRDVFFDSYGGAATFDGQVLPPLSASPFPQLVGDCRGGVNPATPFHSRASHIRNAATPPVTSEVYDDFCGLVAGTLGTPAASLGSTPMTTGMCLGVAPLQSMGSGMTPVHARTDGTLDLALGLGCTPTALLSHKESLQRTSPNKASSPTTHRAGSAGLTSDEARSLASAAPVRSGLAHSVAPLPRTPRPFRTGGRSGTVQSARSILSATDTLLVGAVSPPRTGETVSSCSSVGTDNTIVAPCEGVIAHATKVASVGPSPPTLVDDTSAASCAGETTLLGMSIAAGSGLAMSPAPNAGDTRESAMSAPYGRSNAHVGLRVSTADASLVSACEALSPLPLRRNNITTSGNASGMVPETSFTGDLSEFMDSIMVPTPVPITRSSTRVAGESDTERGQAKVGRGASEGLNLSFSGMNVTPRVVGGRSRPARSAVAGRLTPTMAAAASAAAGRSRSTPIASEWCRSHPRTRGGGVVGHAAGASAVRRSGTGQLSDRERQTLGDAQARDVLCSSCLGFFLV